jgi:hypothetical protein
VTGFVDDLYEDCGQTIDWTMQGVQQLATILVPSGTFPSEQPSRDAMNGAFLSAVLSRDVSKATQVGKLSGN